MDQEASVLLNRAAALRRSGRVDEAIAAYEQLLEREPDLPDSWYNLGLLRRRARRFDAALAAYREALKRGVREPEEVHVNCAVILSDQLARADQAEAALNAALICNPDYLPALLNLGNLHEDFGRRDEAQATYQRALSVEPNNALALSRVAGLTPPQSEAAPELIERLRAAIAAPGRNAADRADLGFGLGRLLDGRGDYAQAFEAYANANRASRESFGPGFRGYDRAAHEAFVDRLIAANPKPAASGDDGAPVFILGMFRSGSTLVEQILAGHSRVVSGGELDLIPTLAGRIAGYPERIASADDQLIATWRSFYSNGLAPFARDGSLTTDKRPDNFLHVGLIKTLFPGAKIVHSYRNRLDNLLALYFLHLDPGMPYALDLNDAAHWYAQYERLMRHWKALYPEDIFDVDYDELVSEPKPVVDRLLGFLGLPWEDALLDFHRLEGPVKTASVWQVREPLHARSSGRWRNYERELRLLPI